MAEFRMPTKDDARAEFWRVKKQIEAIEAKAKPFRDAYEAKRAELERIRDKELEPLRQKMHAAEDGLHDLSNDLARLAKYVGHETGAAPNAKS